MPIFEIEKDGKVYEVDAPSMEAAIASLDENQTPTPLPAAATKGMLQPSTVTGKRDQQIVPGPVGEAFIGAGERTGEMVEGLLGLPGAVYRDPVGVAKGVLPAMWEGAKDTAGDIASGEPRRLGRAAVDVATLAPVTGPVLRGGKAAAMAGGRTVARGLEAAVATPERAALSGGIVGGVTGGVPGALAGASAAVLGQGTLGRGARAMRRVMGDRPGPAAGSRVVPGTPVATLEDELMAALDEMRQPGQVQSVELPPSSPAGGGYTTPPPASQPAGGRLSAGSGPRPAFDQQLAEELMRRAPASSAELPLAHPTGGGFTVPPGMESTRPLVTMSPKAEAAMRKLSKPGAKEPTGASRASAEVEYRALARKPVKSVEDWQRLDALKQIMSAQARRMGLSYAAGGK